jgi:hypothetical protein
MLCCARCGNFAEQDVAEDKPTLDLSDHFSPPPKEISAPAEDPEKIAKAKAKAEKEAKRKAAAEAKERAAREAKRKAQEEERLRLEKEKQEEEQRLARLGILGRPGAKLQVELEDGWHDCAPDEFKQICDHVAGGGDQFPIQARGAMYFIDWRNPAKATQKNMMTGKMRNMRCLAP